MAACQYVINCPCDLNGPPQVTPAGGTYDNDFVALLSLFPWVAGPSDTICYTLDGTDPHCDSIGHCAAPARTYDPQKGVPIDGTITGVAGLGPGQVVLKAEHCGIGPGLYMAPVIYTLQAGPPTLEGPAPDPALHSYAAGGLLQPTVASITLGATGRYTTDSKSLPSCASGTSLGSLPSSGAIALAESAGNQTVYAVACKPGYKDSALTTAPYTVTLAAPSVGAAAPPGTYDAPVSVTLDDSRNAGATGEYACVTTDGVTPAACSATGCAGGQRLANGAAIPFATDRRTAGSPLAGALDVDGTVVDAVACSPSFAASPRTVSAPYHEKLDGVAFQCSAIAASGTFQPCTTATSTVAAGGHLWVQASESSVAGQEAYDFLCVSSDGTNPDCACDTTAAPALTKVPASSLPWTSPSLGAGARVKAVGCLSPTTSSTGNGSLGDVFQPSDAPYAIQDVTASGRMRPPVLVPLGPDLPAPTVVRFANGGPDPAYFCFTTDGSPPVACLGVGSTSGSTTCTAAATPANATSSDGASVGATGAAVRAIACDAPSGSGLAASVEASAVYALVVGTPVITAKGAAQYGQGVVVTSATPGALIQYATDGTTPDCSAAYGAITTGTTPDAAGLYEATYYAMGLESGALVVTGCKPGYAPSRASDRTTFTYATAQPGAFYDDGGKPVAVVAGATYDDYLPLTLALPAAAGGGANTWFCVGPSPACRAAAGQCVGASVIAIPASCLNTTVSGATAHSAGQSAGPPECSATGFRIPMAGVSNPSAVACVPSQAGTVQSPALDLTVSFVPSAPVLITPPSNAGVADVQFWSVQSHVPPDGDTSTLGATNNLTSQSGSAAYLCAASFVTPLGPQPPPCGSLQYLQGWTCQASTGTGGLGDPGPPKVTLAHQGIDGTYAVVMCKDGMPWSTASVPVTFASYVHSPAFVATGSASDFTAATEKLAAASDGASAYVTFDASNLYVGFDRGSALAPSDVVHVYIGSANGSGTYLPDTVVPTGGAFLPTTAVVMAWACGNFNARYHVYWRADGSAHGMDAWSGAAWSTAGDPATTTHLAGSTFVEMSIPLSALAGTNGDLHLLGGVWTGTATVGAWPPGDPGPGQAVWSGWQTVRPAYAFPPNDKTLSCLP